MYSMVPPSSFGRMCLRSMLRRKGIAARELDYLPGFAPWQAAAREFACMWAGAGYSYA